MRTEFVEDVLSLISEEPKLLNDIIDSLRGRFLSIPSGRRWKNVRKEDVEAILVEYGAFFGSRRHGSGIAEYVASARFTEVLDGRHHRMVPVQEGR